MLLRLSNEAQRNLIDIEIDGIERFGADRAAAYIDAIFERFDLLTDFPLLGAKALLTGDVRLSACQSHLILYRAANDFLTVLAIRHGRENWQARLKDLH